MTRIVVDATEVKACSACNKVVDPEDENDVETMYECNDCGEFSANDGDGSNRCPECNKFASKSDEVKTVCCGDDVVDAFQFEDIEGNEAVIKEEDVEVLADEPAPEVDPAIVAMNKRGRAAK